MQTPSRVITMVAVVALAAGSACSGGSGAGRPSTGATPNANVAATAAADTGRCPAAVRGVDVSSWRVVAQKQFTLCLPPGWQGRGSNAHQGRSTINWGTGNPQTKRIGVTTREVLRPGQRPLPPELPPGSETNQFAEDIGGHAAKLYRNRLNGTYYVGATWETESVWVNGDTPDSEVADLILAVARTVRFVTR